MRAELVNKNIFTGMDLRDGYYPLPLSKERSELGTFSSPFDYFSSQRLPFGISCAT